MYGVYVYVTSIMMVLCAASLIIICYHLACIRDMIKTHISSLNERIIRAYKNDMKKLAAVDLDEDLPVENGEEKVE